MAATPHEHLILEGLQGLPAEALAEIADFVYFVRKRVLQPQAFLEEVEALLTRDALTRLSRAETEHLEKEFDGYEQRFPRE
jgi:hypothetical protein